MLILRRLTGFTSRNSALRQVWRGALLLLALTLCSKDASAQDSIVDTIYIDTMFIDTGSFDAGDTIWVGLGLANTFAVGALVYRLEVEDTTLIRPIFEVDTISGSYPVVMRLINRGLVFDKSEAITSVVVPHPDTTNILRGVLIDFAGTANIAVGTGLILELAFVAKAGIQQGDSALIRVRDNLTSGIDPGNNLSDVTGTIFVLPRLRNGVIIFGTPEDTTGTPGNNPPVITFEPAQTAYTITQGETVAFDITATDPDTTNDIVTLSVGLPPGAVFTPSNPTSGTITVSGSFEWIPNFSQEGVFNVDFSASDDKGASSSRIVSITVEKQDIDLLFTGSPVGGIPGKTPVLIPIDVLASRDIYGIQFDLVLDGTAFHVDSLITTSKLDNFTVFDNIGLNPDTIRIITFSVSGDSIPLAGGTTIMNIAVSVDSAAAAGTFPLTFVNALEAIVPDPDVGSVEMTIQNGELFVDAFGDVNLDLSLDVADMVGLTSHILGTFTLSPRQFDVSDVNLDAFANVIDLVAIINAVLGFDTLTAFTAPPFAGGEAELNLVYGGMANDQALYFVEGYMPTEVAGLELSYTFDFDKMEPWAPIATGEATGMTVQSHREANGRMKIVVYYDGQARNVIPKGKGRYLVIPVQVKELWPDMETPPMTLDLAVVSDPNAAKVFVKGQDTGPIIPESFVLHQNYPNPFNPSTTIRFEIGAAAGEEVSLNVFNILGRHVISLTSGSHAAGTYEVVWDGHDKYGSRVASGVFFYRLQVGEEVATRKMVLLK